MNEEENCLILESSNRWIIAGIYGAEIAVEEVIEAPRSSLQILPEMIQRLLKKARIEKPAWITAARGPGSFTGIRICVAFARNLAQLWAIPVLGIPSLYFYCYDLLKKNKMRNKEGLALLIRAKQSKIYGLALPASASSPDSKQERSMAHSQWKIVYESPEQFLSSLARSSAIYADDPENICNMMGAQAKEKLSLHDREIRKMPAPEAKHLYHLALEYFGGKKHASPWYKLQALYFRKNSFSRC